MTMTKTLMVMGRLMFGCGRLAWALVGLATGARARAERREAEAERRLVLRVATATAASSDFSAYQPNAIFPFKVTDRDGVVLGTLKLWFCPRTREFARDFTFLHKGLVETFGSRNVAMKPLKLTQGDTVAALRELSLREVETLLKKRLFVSGPAVQPSAVALVAPVLPVSPAVAAPETPRAARQVVAEKAPAPAPAESAARVRASGAKMRSEHDGVLVGFGFAQRAVPDEKEPNGTKSIEQFYVDLELIAGATKGRPKRIWGNDLERALSAGNIQRDMLVRVAYYGKTRIQVSDDSGRLVDTEKNLYEVTQIGGRK